MKRWLGMLVVFSALCVLLCCSVFADGGFMDIQAEEGYQLTPLTADDSTPQTAAIDGGGSYYVDSVKIGVTTTNDVDANSFYLITAQSAEVPTETTIQYIDQKTGEVSFTVYPNTSKLVSGETYTIYLYSNDGSSNPVKVGTFKYYAPYAKGDVNMQDGVTAADAALTLQASVELVELSEAQKALADVAAPFTQITSADAALILQASVGLITL